MAETMTVPGVGPVKKPVVVLVAGGAVAVLIYAYWRRANNPTPAAADSTSSDATSTSDSGYVQDSTADGYNTIYPPTYSQNGYDVYGNPLPAPTGLGSGGTYTTNDEWTSAAESSLETAGVSLSVSGAAISKVLGGLSVSSDQRDIFMQAVGLLGQPPQGYPTPIKVSDSGTGPTKPTYPPGTSLPSPPGLHATSVGSTTAGLAWLFVPGAAKYRIYDRHHSTHIAETSDTHYTVHGLQRHSSDYFHVRPVGHDGQIGQSSPELHVTTKK